MQKCSLANELVANIFAFASAARLQILPCGRSGEICSEREPCIVRLAVRLFLVGVARFELAALRSRTVRATKLRYTPIVVFNYVVSSQNRNVFLCLVARLALTEGFADVSLFGVLPVSRCVAPSLPLPYATQTALHPDSGIQLCCFVPKQERFLLFGSASRAHRRFCPRALRAANAQLY